MAKKKYYAVRNGKEGSAIYFNWDDCLMNVAGVPGVEYKSFSDIHDAEMFLDTGYKTLQICLENKLKWPHKPDTAIAYTDGSFNQELNTAGAGAVMFYNHDKIEFADMYVDNDGLVNNEAALVTKLRNIAGEIMAAANVISYCLEHKIKSLEIHHDYNGIAAWADGTWTANDAVTKVYKTLCETARLCLDIKFIHVPGHSGNVWNEYADRLARKAAGF